MRARAVPRPGRNVARLPSAPRRPPPYRSHRPSARRAHPRSRTNRRSPRRCDSPDRRDDIASRSAIPGRPEAAPASSCAANADERLLNPRPPGISGSGGGAGNSLSGVPPDPSTTSAMTGRPRYPLHAVGARVRVTLATRTRRATQLRHTGPIPPAQRRRAVGTGRHDGPFTQRRLFEGGEGPRGPRSPARYPATSLSGGAEPRADSYGQESAALSLCNLSTRLTFEPRRCGQ